MKPILVLQIPTTYQVVFNFEKLEKHYHLIVVKHSKEFLVKIISKPGEYAS